MKILRAEAKRQKLPDDRIEVFTSESLSSWLDQYPAISWALKGLQPGYLALNDWATDVRHREGWFPTPALTTSSSQLQQALNPGGQSHVHVWGRPGVGKTRFVLEACKGSSWASSVLDVPQPTEVSVSQVLSAATQAQATLVLVVDEASPSLLGDWGAAAHRSNGRVRLVTIGHTGALDPTHLTQLSIEPLGRGEMLAAVSAWHPNMPPEHHDFITDFSDGYVRLAKLTGDAVSKDPSLNARDLFSRHDISALMTALLGSGERRKLQVVAVLSSVGWEGDRAKEGAAVAAHLGFSWDEVRAAVQEFDTRLGIAPRAGDLRYISPVPLGVYLAIEAWETYRDKMASLADILPTEAAKSAYYERLQAVLASPSAKEFAQEELRLFFSWDKFLGESDVERWAAISRADPLVAAQQVRRALERATRDQRLQIKEKARRNLVNALTDLAWSSSTFVDAVLSLASLADAENESWANNATGSFGATTNYFLEERPRRMSTAWSPSTCCWPGPRTPTGSWLSMRSRRLASHTHLDLLLNRRIDGAREPEWQPNSEPEYLAAIDAALQRLCRVAAAARPGLSQPLEKATKQLDLLLRHRETRGFVADLMRAIAAAYPDIKIRFRQD